MLATVGCRCGDPSQIGWSAQSRLWDEDSCESAFLKERLSGKTARRGAREQTGHGKLKSQCEPDLGWGRDEGALDCQLHLRVRSRLEVSEPGVHARACQSSSSCEGHPRGHKCPGTSG